MQLIFMRKNGQKKKPGTHVHGAVVLANGDLIFNFEHLGLVRLDKGKATLSGDCLTGHIIQFMSPKMAICGFVDRSIILSRFLNYLTTNLKFIEPTILEVTVDGKIIREISVFDLLLENGYEGLLSMSTTDNKSTIVTGDTLHLNDVEPFPQSMEEGFFQARGCNDIIKKHKYHSSFWPER